MISRMKTGTETINAANLGLMVRGIGRFARLQLEWRYELIPLVSSRNYQRNVDLATHAKCWAPNILLNVSNLKETVKMKHFHQILVMPRQYSTLFHSALS